MAKIIDDQRRSTLVIDVLEELCKSKPRSVRGQGPVIHAQKTGWQSVVRSCIVSGPPTYVVQGLNANTVDQTLTFFCSN